MQCEAMHIHTYIYKYIYIHTHICYILYIHTYVRQMPVGNMHYMMITLNIFIIIII